jgi:PhzF family phenazine biosynthesis protein
LARHAKVLAEEGEEMAEKTFDEMAEESPICGVDAFAEGPFRGNPAAVCLLASDADPAWMQSVAAEMNLSETAFVRIGGGAGADRGRSVESVESAENRGATIGLRWFTPKTEVALCGHATLASAHVLWESGRLGAGDAARFTTRSGVLTARRRDDGWIEMDFPARDPVAAQPPEGLIEALGVQPASVHRSGEGDYLVELVDADAVRAVEPDLAALGRIEARGVIVTARAGAGAGDDDGEDLDFVSRFFAPAVGVPEDPVTGSAHCALAPFWSRRLRKDHLRAYQASARGGIVEVTVRGDRVGLAGRAVTVWEGRLRV